MITRLYRKNILDETIKCFNDKKYIVDNNEIKLNEKDINESVQNTMKMSYNYINTLFAKKDIKPVKGKILIVNGDSFEVAIITKLFGFNTVVLNMASRYHPGGGYKRGASAQEEALFYRSNLSFCLDGIRVNELYPMENTEIIYTPNSLVIRDTEKNNYKLLKDYEKISVITCSAYKCRYHEHFLNNRARNNMRKKMEMILKTGILKGHDCIILGAFGCGAYRNPPKQVAELFSEFVYDFLSYYKYIIFAIYDDINSYQNSKEGNLTIFSKYFDLPIVSCAELSDIINR